MSVSPPATAVIPEVRVGRSLLDSSSKMGGRRVAKTWLTAAFSPSSMGLRGAAAALMPSKPRATAPAAAPKPAIRDGRPAKRPTTRPVAGAAAAMPAAISHPTLPMPRNVPLILLAWAPMLVMAAAPRRSPLWSTPIGTSTSAVAACAFNSPIRARNSAFALPLSN